MIILASWMRIRRLATRRADRTDAVRAEENSHGKGCYGGIEGLDLFELGLGPCIHSLPFLFWILCISDVPGVQYHTGIGDG